MNNPQAKVNKYQNATIYKIVNSVNDHIYVGAACMPLAKRMSEHRTRSKTNTDLDLYKAMNELGLQHFRIILVEQYPCENKMQLVQREQYWCDILKPQYNKPPAIRLDAKEYDKKYREEHKEQIKAKQKQYREENKVHIQAKNKQYREQHKEELSAKNKQYREENKEHIQAQRKQYREEHKEQIKAQRDATYTCDACKREFALRKKAQHEQTKRHLKFVQKEIHTGELYDKQLKEFEDALF